MLDKPGFGFSDNFLAWQNADPLTMYDEFIAQLVANGEGSSFVMVGWGGGGNLMYEYALSHPEHAAGFAFLDTVANGIEWREVAARDSLTQAQLDENKNIDLAGRSFIFGLLRGIGARWGLLTVFVPGQRDAYAWPERFDEFYWFSVTPKTWTTQWFSLLPSYTTQTPIDSIGVFDRSSAALIGRPVVMVATNRSRAAVCEDRKEEDCTKAMFAQAFQLAEKHTIANVTGNATITYCTAEDCSLDAVRRLPAFVANAILNQTWAALP
jgi:pimeloyl-ACP methyl ester carboxylesterase